jgi:hypothetical protein
MHKTYVTCTVCEVSQLLDICVLSFKYDVLKCLGMVSNGQKMYHVLTGLMKFVVVDSIHLSI